MQDERGADGGSDGWLRRLGPRQWRMVGAAVVAVIVIVILVAVITSRRGGEPTDADVERRLKDAVSEAVADAAGANEGVDLAELDGRLERARGRWVIDLDAAPDRRTVGLAARQPDGPNCLFVWSSVGGAKSALVTDPNLPCVGAIALVAAR